MCVYTSLDSQCDTVQLRLNTHTHDIPISCMMNGAQFDISLVLGLFRLPAATVAAAGAGLLPFTYMCTCVRVCLCVL